MREQAFILPAQLLLLTLLLILLAPLQDDLIMAIRAKAETSLSEQANKKAINEVLANAFDYVAPSTTRSSNKCFSATGQAGRVTLERRFCSSFHSAAMSLLSKSRIDSTLAGGFVNLSSLDFGKLFPNPKDCLSSGGKPKAGSLMALSSGSAASSKTCQLMSGTISQAQTIASNLEIPSSLALGTSGSLSVGGYLVAPSELSISQGSHYIIAAGDIQIERLSALQAAELTIISASGDLRLNFISGPLTLRVYAANKTILPAGTQFSTSGFNDLALDFLPLGFSE